MAESTAGDRCASDCLLSQPVGSLLFDFRLCKYCRHPRGLAIPYVGSAQAEDTVIVKERHERYWNMGPRHEKTVIIKRSHRDMDRY